MYNVNQEQTAEKIIIKKDHEALQEILCNEKGRWFIARMLDRCQILSITNTSDTATILIQEGKRRIGLKLLDDIQTIGLDAIALKQTAEMEYANTMKKIREWRENSERQNV